MNIWQWIKTHPQRTSSLLLGVIGSLETGLALMQTALPPVWSGLIKMFFAALMASLAWAVKNLKDEP